MSDVSELMPPPRYWRLRSLRDDFITAWKFSVAPEQSPDTAYALELGSFVVTDDPDASQGPTIGGEG